MMKKKILSLVLITICVVSMGACGPKKEDSGSADSKKEEKTLVMATNAEFPPYEYYEGSEIVGIDVDIAQAIASELGMKLKVEDMAFDSIVAAVSSGKVQIGAAGMTVTEERLENVDFTNSYATGTQVIIVKEDSEIGQPGDLKGKKVGVQLGTTGDLFAEKIEDADIERYNKGFEAVQALGQGKIDAVIIDGEPAKKFVDEAKELKILDEAFTKEAYAIAVKKGNDELKDNINKALVDLESSGKLDEIISKYINADSAE